jgi:hypothetical protein
MIFDQNYLIFQKNLNGRNLVACPNSDHNIKFSPFGGNIVRQTDFSPKGMVLENNFCNTFYKILISGQIIENENTYPVSTPPQSLVNLSLQNSTCIFKTKNTL